MVEPELLEEVKLQLEGLKLDTTDFEKYAKDYVATLPHEMRESCGGADIVAPCFKKMEEGYERHYMKFTGLSGGNTSDFGLVCINIDQSQSAGPGHRAFIRHISVNRLDLLK